MAADSDRANVYPFPEPSQEERLAVRTQEIGSAMLGPKTIGQALEWARILFGSELVPKSYKTPADVLVCMLFGGELGLSAVQSLQNIAVVNGKASVYGDAPLGIVLQRTGDHGSHAGQLEKFEETWQPDVDGGKWTTTVKRKGRELVVRSFSMADAAKIKYSEWDNTPGAPRGQKKTTTLDQKETYQNYPRRMCKFKARHEALRDTFPDLLLGIIGVDEAEEITFRQGIDLEGEIVSRDGVKLETLEDLIGKMEIETAKSVVAGFDALNLSRAERLVRLREFKGQDAKLLEWLKDEYAKIKTRGIGRKHAAPAQPAETSGASLPSTTTAAPGPVERATSEASAGTGPDRNPPPETATPAAVKTTNKAATTVLF